MNRKELTIMVTALALFLFFALQITTWAGTYRCDIADIYCTAGGACIDNDGLRVRSGNNGSVKKLVYLTWNIPSDLDWEEAEITLTTKEYDVGNGSGWPPEPTKFELRKTMTDTTTGANAVVIESVTTYDPGYISTSDGLLASSDANGWSNTTETLTFRSQTLGDYLASKKGGMVTVALIISDIGNGYSDSSGPSVTFEHRESDNSGSTGSEGCIISSSSEDPDLVFYTSNSVFLSSVAAKDANLPAWPLFAGVTLLVLVIVGVIFKSRHLVN